MYTKKLCFIVLVILILSVVIGTTGAAAPVVPIGNWGLEDSFNLVYGMRNSTTYTYSEMQNLYINNYKNVQSTEMYIENNDLLYQQYSLEFDSTNEDISDTRKLIEQNNSLALSYQNEADTSTGSKRDEAVRNVQQCLLNSEAYQKELADLIAQKAELYVQKESCLFIYNNGDKLRNINRISQITDFRDNIYKTKVLNENYLLQKTLVQYAGLQVKAEDTNKSKGMSFQTDVDYYNADVDYYTNQQEFYNLQANENLESLLDNSDVDITKSTIITVRTADLRSQPLKIYSDVEKNSFLNDYKSMQLGDKIRILDGKISILKEYYPDSSIKVKLAQNEKKQAELEGRKWFVQRKTLIKDYYAEYSSKYNEIGINEKKAKAFYQKYIILLNKYNYGIATELSVKEAEVNYKKAAQEAWNSMYDYSEALGKVEKAISGSIE